MEEEVKRIFEADSVLCGLITQAFAPTSLSPSVFKCVKKKYVWRGVGLKCSCIY